MNQDALDPAGPAEQELSAVLDRFEEAWQEGTVPNLETFLPTAVLAGSRQELLSELVKLDLEFRWRQKQSSRPDDTLIQPGKQEQETLIYDSSAAANAWLLEKYVEEYPQLGSVDQLPLALIVEEYRVRQRWGDRPSHQDYLERFAERNEDLSAALSGVDQELAAEREGTGPGQGQVSTETVTVVAGQDRKNGPGSAIGVGSVVGDYELLQEIGRGGMGVVYRARQLSLQREVALKMILPGQLADQEAVERFYSEAQIVGQLRHPNIVMVYEVAEHDGNHYFSMDYIEGDSLADLTRSLSEKAAAEYVVKIASAIQFAHEAGILHRDLKPSNILIDAGSQPLVTDFGLAKRTKEDSGLTKTGNIIGTPSYMSPEQVAIGKEDKLGPASDVYSLGAILYELLTGCPPFRSDSMLETLMQVLEREPVAPRLLAPATDRDLETITLKCLEKDPQRRYGSATELADELNRYLEGEPILARPVSGLERAWRWCKRKPALVGMWAVAVLLLLTVSIAVPAVWQSRQDADQAKKDQLAAAEQSRSEKARAAEKRLEEERKLREQQSLAEEKLATERLASLKSEAAALERFGLYSIALPVYEKMVELRDQLRTKDLRQALSEKQSLVNLYATLGRFDAMARVCETITQEIKKLPAADYAEDQLVAMNNLAYAYEMNGDFKRAREIYESTYQQLVSSLGATHPKTLVVQNNLAVCLAAMGESEKAFSLLKENIGQRKKLVTAGDVSSEFVLAPNSNLCWLYFQFGLLAKADEQYDEYFAIEDSGVAGGNKVEKLRAAATKQLVELHFDHNEKLAELLLFVESLVEADDSDFMRIQREGGPRLANIIVSTDPIMALGRSRKDTHVAIFQEPKPGQGPTGAAGPGPVLDRSFDWRPKERVVVLLPLVLPNSPTPPTIVNLPTAFAAINEKVANARQVEIEKRSLFVFGSLLDNYLKQGDLARAQGHRETATQYYEQALTLVQWLDEPQFQVGLFGAEYVWFLEEKRVDVYARLGRVDDAKACINQLIDRTHRLLELIAKNTSAEVANDASVSATEQAAEAKTFEERILRDIEEEVIYPEELEDGLVLAYVKRGDLELVEGRSDEAAVSYGKALSLSSELNLEAESYPAYLALANVSMAKIVRGRGDLETEAMLLGKAREQWKEIVDARRSPLKGCPLPSDSERLRKYLDQEIRLEQKEYFSVYCTWGELDGNVNEWWIHELERVAGIALLEMDRYKEAESFF